MKPILAMLAIMVALAKPAVAEPPRIVTDIAPVHSLAAMVMEGVAGPEVLLPPGASPHDFALRPSDALNLSRADAVIWIGKNMTPWLARSIDALATEAISLELINVANTFTLPYRSGAVFGGKDAHGHDKHDHDEHVHNGEIELHAWQDPENAKVWLDAIADLLSDLDAENAKVYRANAHAAKQKIDAVSARLLDELRPLRGRGFIVSHDAYHYFENRFGVSAIASLLAGDAGPASAARLQAVSQLMHESGPICIFVEPQIPDALANTLAAEHGSKIGVLDPIGDQLERGPNLYQNMLIAIADGLRDCLS